MKPMSNTTRGIGIMVCLSMTVGCTENARTKRFGGSMTINLPNCQKMIMPTWKEGNLWYATRPMRSDENPETTTFQEESSFGVMEGKVTFIESCSK